MGRNVLVVDDDAAFRSLARRLLIAFGFAPAGEADSVSAALAMAGTLRPDVVLVGGGWPDGDGITLAGLLTALPWHPRVILTSSDADAATPDDVLRSGA